MQEKVDYLDQKNVDCTTKCSSLMTFLSNIICIVIILGFVYLSAIFVENFRKPKEIVSKPHTDNCEWSINGPYRFCSGPRRQ